MESFQAIEKLNSTPDLAPKHFEDGTINLEDVLEEVQYLKQQVGIFTIFSSSLKIEMLTGY